MEFTISPATRGDIKIGDVISTGENHLRVLRVEKSFNRYGNAIVRLTLAWLDGELKNSRIYGEPASDYYGCTAYRDLEV